MRTALIAVLTLLNPRGESRWGVLARVAYWPPRLGGWLDLVGSLFGDFLFFVCLAWLR